MKLSAVKEIKIMSWVMAVIGVALAMYVWFFPDTYLVPLIVAGFLIAYGFGHIYRIKQFE
jgi:fatty acid desaturase